jgi:hypothetical protein
VNGVTDMSRRGGGGAPDHQARYNIGALEQRVYGLEQGVAGLSSQISGLSQQISASGKTNWTVIIGFGGIALSFMIAIGGMAYWPIRETQSDMKANIAKLTDIQASFAEKFVSIRELDARSSRSTDERRRLEQDIDGIQKDLVPRAEHTERWRSVDKQFEYQQRQLDERKRFEADMISVPSFLKDMNERLRAMEFQRAKGP